MKCLVLIILVLSININRCELINDDDSNIVPKERTIKYYTKQNEITIPIMIHLDSALARTLPRQSIRKLIDKFKLLANDILKDVEELFRQPNLQLKIKLELLDLRVLRNSSDAFVMTENVSQYLKGYCTWQGVKKVMKQKWYYSVLFTGLDLFYLKNHGIEVRKSTGRSYMNGVCSEKNSCTLLEWHPKNIAYMLAHEIAHSLGVSHDGPPHNDCRDQRYIMDPKYNPQNPAKSWSPCSKTDLKEFLKSKLAWCLKQDVDNLTVNKNP